jgi:hypothetical protein
MSEGQMNQRVNPNQSESEKSKQEQKNNIWSQVGKNADDLDNMLDDIEAKKSRCLE